MNNVGNNQSFQSVVLILLEEQDIILDDSKDCSVLELVEENKQSGVSFESSL